MVDTEPLSPALLPQEPTLQLLSSDHGRPQEQQHQQRESDLALYHHSYQQHQQHHHPDQSIVPFQPQDSLEDMTRDFLIQDASPDPSNHGSSPLLLQQHPDGPAEIEEELNIYDYIHAKQEDEEEPDDPSRNSSGSTLAALEPTLDSSLRRASHHSIAADTSSLVDSAYFPSSPSSSSPSASSPSSPSSPTESSPMHHERIGTCANTLGRHGDTVGDMEALSHESDYLTSSIKQRDLEENDASALMHHSSYLDDSPVDLYGPMQSSQGEGDIHSPLPAPDLFRTLMDELQTQAAIQREKFFSDTTGSDTGMDSVEFLFKGQHTQTPSQSQSQPGTPSTKQCPQFMTEVAADSMFVSEVNATSEQSDDQDLSITQPCSSANMAEVIKAEDADPSLSSSSIASELKRRKGSSSPRTEEVYVAITRITKRRRLSAATRNTATTTALAQMDSSSVEVTVDYGSGQRSASVTPNSEQSSSSVHKQVSVERAAGSQDRSRTKRRKASHGQVVAQSPIQDALPSPPASVQTTPPMRPMSQDLTLDAEELELPAASTVHPVTPPSPTQMDCTVLGEDATEPELSTDSSRPDMDAAIVIAACTSIVSTPATGSKSLKKAAAPSGAVNKRPWTPEEEKLLLELVDNKTPIKDIAETLSRSVHSVRSRRQVLTDPGFVKGNGHAQPRRAKPDPSSKLPTYSQMAFLSLARLPELQGTLNDVASMVEKLFSRHLNRIPRTGHKNLQIWRAQISDALAHEKGHPRPRFESFGIKRGRQWVYRLTAFGKGVMEAMGSVDRICDDLLKNNEMARGSHGGSEGDRVGGAGAGLGQGNGYGYSYSAETTTTCASSLGSRSPSSSAENERFKIKMEATEESSAESLAVSNAIANAMAAMAAGMAAMTAAEDEKSAAAGTTILAPAASAMVESRKVSESVERTKKAKAGLDSHDTKCSAPPAATGGRSGKRQRTKE
ncbi:hypothetical protein BGZ75_005933 [Mortierella antarctica]|nr:hypothetical protein BGZ75_005933 [Mortierella antarctica]